MSAAPVLMLRINRCSAPHLWYVGKVGQLVPFVQAGIAEWWSREDAGHLNIVRLDDADLVEVRDGCVSSIPLPE